MRDLLAVLLGWAVLGLFVVSMVWVIAGGPR